MAFTSGTAANYKDLLAVMTTMAAANGWVILEQSETKVYLKGTGAAGLDEIYVGAETYENPTSGIYNWNLFGSWGYRAGREFSKMPHSSYSTNWIPTGCFWNTSIDYWIACDTRRIIVAAKIGTTYQMVHLGFITPVGTDAQYPYPLLLGGVYKSNAYGYQATAIASFWSTVAAGIDTGLLCLPSGSWGKLNTSTSENTTNQTVQVEHLLMSEYTDLLDSPDGSYLLEPIYLTAVGSNRNTYGLIEGLFKVSGYNNTSENIITVDGVNYIVFQDCYRSGFGDFCALRMT